jgi:hypothetical protein
MQNYDFIKSIYEIFIMFFLISLQFKQIHQEYVKQFPKKIDPLTFSELRDEHRSRGNESVSQYIFRLVNYLRESFNPVSEDNK